MKAAGVNRADCWQREGNYPPPAGASEVIGLECCGTVLEARPCSPPGLCVNMCSSLFTPTPESGESFTAEVDLSVAYVQSTGHTPGCLCTVCTTHASRTVSCRSRGFSSSFKVLSQRSTARAEGRRCAGGELQGGRARNGASRWRRLRRGGAPPWPCSCSLSSECRCWK